MTEFDYPPSRAYTLEAAHADVDDRLADLDERIERLEDDDDASDRALGEARSERSDVAAQRDALAWAIDEFGGDAEVVLQAFTANRRARVLDTLQTSTMGEVGTQQTRTWLVAGSVQRAPWLSGDEDLQTRAEVTGALPPALVDWLDNELADLNDLSEGN